MMKKHVSKPSPKKPSPKKSSVKSMVSSMPVNESVSIRKISNGFITSAWNSKTNKSVEKFTPDNPLGGRS